MLNRTWSFFAKMGYFVLFRASGKPVRKAGIPKFSVRILALQVQQSTCYSPPQLFFTCNYILLELLEMNTNGGFAS